MAFPSLTPSPNQGDGDNGNTANGNSAEDQQRSNALFAWSAGMPQPSGGRVSKAMQKEQINQLLLAALSLPYKGVWNADTQQYEMDDPDYANATYGEVISHKLVQRAAAQGDIRAIQEVLDRTLGKPKQAVESVNMSLSYTDFLEQLAQQSQGQSQNTPSRKAPDPDTMYNNYLLELSNVEDIIDGV